MSSDVTMKLSGQFRRRSVQQQPRRKQQLYMREQKPIYTLINHCICIWCKSMEYKNEWKERINDFSWVIEHGVVHTLGPNKINKSNTKWAARLRTNKTIKYMCAGEFGSSMTFGRFSSCLSVVPLPIPLAMLWTRMHFDIGIQSLWPCGDLYCVNLVHIIQNVFIDPTTRYYMTCSALRRN